MLTYIIIVYNLKLAPTFADHSYQQAGFAFEQSEHSIDAIEPGKCLY
jgi:hypothetical protein